MIRITTALPDLLRCLHNRHSARGGQHQVRFPLLRQATLPTISVHDRNAPSPSPKIFAGSIVMDNANPALARPWYEIVQQTLKRNDVKLVTYVPDKVFTLLIRNLH